MGEGEEGNSGQTFLFIVKGKKKLDITTVFHQYLSCYCLTVLNSFLCHPQIKDLAQESHKFFNVYHIFDALSTLTHTPAFWFLELKLTSVEFGDATRTEY